MMDSRRADELITQIRTQCLRKGKGGIKHLGVVFRVMDRDFSKKLCFDEFRRGIKMFGLNVADNDLKLLFKAFDKDKNNHIDFAEFVAKLRPSMKRSRRDVINEAFDSLDVIKDNEIKMDDLKIVYTSNARRHPKFLSGEWTEEETLRNFLDSIDTPGCPDGKVTREEFMNYYSGVSALVEDDCYFDLMMRACYGLPNKGHTKS